MEGFSERLKKFRAIEGLTQEELAVKLGISPQAVSKWETGKSLPETGMIVPMAKLFHISADELLGNVSSPEEWEKRWQEALRTGGEAAASLTAQKAVKELPHNWTFRYREASGEYIAAQNAGDEAEKNKYLLSAEAHFRSILRDWPKSDSAASMLVQVLTALERRQEAEELARGLPDCERLLLQVLQGDALAKQKLRVVALAGMEFVFALCSLPRSLAALDLAERIIRDAPWDRADRTNFLITLLYNRAVLYCGSGDADSAMASLEEIPCVLRELDAPENPRDRRDDAPYLARLAEMLPVSEYWRMAASSLEFSHELDGLREREDFKALLREIRARCSC